MKNKTLKKAVSAALATAMCTGLLFGCGNASDSTSEKKPASNDPLRIVIWNQDQKAGLDQIVSEFTEETGIKAEIEVKDWDSYWTLLEAGAVGGDMPDVFWMHSNKVYQYMSNDKLLDLTPYIEKDQYNMDAYPAEIKELYSNGGKTYAIPKDVDTIALWYNKTLFDEAGIAYPDENWTWDDFYDAACSLTKKDGSQYGYAMRPDNTQDGWYSMLYSMGGHIINEDRTKSGYDDPKTLEVMEFVDKMLKNCCPPVNVTSENELSVLFSSGVTAMYTGGSWNVQPLLQNSYIAENCDVALLPKDAASGRRCSIYNGLGWAASADTANPDGAVQLLEWFGSKEMQTKQAELGVTMSAYEGTSDAWIKQTDVVNLQPYLDMMDDIVINPYSNNAKLWNDRLIDELTKVWNGQAKMKDACIAIADFMNTCLADEQK